MYKTYVVINYLIFNYVYYNKCIVYYNLIINETFLVDGEWKKYLLLIFRASNKELGEEKGLL